MDTNVVEPFGKKFERHKKLWKELDSSLGEFRLVPSVFLLIEHAGLEAKALRKQAQELDARLDRLDLSGKHDDEIFQQLYIREDQIREVVGSEAFQKWFVSEIDSKLGLKLKYSPKDPDKISYYQQMLHEHKRYLEGCRDPETWQTVAALISWDLLVSLSFSGIAELKIGEFLFRYWVDACQGGLLLPIGKVLSRLSQDDYGLGLKRQSDLVDAELISLYSIGHKDTDGVLHPVTVITGDEQRVIEARFACARDWLVAFERESGTKIPRQTGQAYFCCY